MTGDQLLAFVIGMLVGEVVFGTLAFLTVFIVFLVRKVQPKSGSIWTGGLHIGTKGDGK